MLTRKTGVPDTDDADDLPEGRGWFAEFVRAWLPAILAVFIIRAFIFEPFRIPSGSMVPTLQVGDHVLVSKFSYGLWMHFPFPKRLGVPSVELLDLGNPKRGDIIVFRYPRDPSTHYIKRVVALPGDRIKVKDNQIILNDELQPRDFLGKYEFVDSKCVSQKVNQYTETITEGDPHHVLTRPGGFGPLADTVEFVVPENRVFVMGDNRDNSEDSRAWKYVRYDQIKGRAGMVWFSLDPCKGGLSFRMDKFFQKLH